MEKKEKQRRVRAAQSNLTAPSHIAQSNLTTLSQTAQSNRVEGNEDDGGIANDDSMIVHMHGDHGDNNEDGGNDDKEEVGNVEEEEEEKEEDEEEDEEDEESESFYEPWRCLSDREIGRGSTPLHLGVEAGQPVCVSMLLRAGANTELIRQDGYTALQLASEMGEWEGAALLVDAGAYVDHPYSIGWTALHFHTHLHTYIHTYTHTYLYILLRPSFLAHPYFRLDGSPHGCILRP